MQKRRLRRSGARLQWGRRWHWWAQLATVETMENEAMDTGYSDDSGSDYEWTRMGRASVSAARSGATASKSRSRGAIRAVQVRLGVPNGVGECKVVVK